MTALEVDPQVEEMWREWVDTRRRRELLRAPFASEHVGYKPTGGQQLAFVGHGAVTARLLDVDEEWTWEPCAIEPSGAPAFVYNADGYPIGFWIKLTVLGVTRPGYGSCPPRQNEAEKVLIGDAIRNAAMRFGVALDLWISGAFPEEEAMLAGERRPLIAAAPEGFDTDEEARALYTDLIGTAKSLSPEDRDFYKDWLGAEGIDLRPPWTRSECDRMLGQLTDLVSRPEEDSDVLGDEE